MLRYVLRRIVFSIPILLIASVLTFWVAKETTTPIGQLRLNPRVSQADIQRATEALGLDKSGPEQYLTWLGNFVQGDWGRSLVSNRDVWPQFSNALYNTFVLGLCALTLSLLIGVIVGVVSAVKQYSWFDYTSTSTAFLGISMPTFWLALVLQVVFAVWLVRWFDLTEPIFAIAGTRTPGTTGFDLWDRIRHLALPTIVLAVQLIAVYSRYMRATMLETLNSDYLRTARAKGLRERRVVVRHGMRNALIPLTTQVAIDLGAIAGGLVVTEFIFQWPGMGTLFLRAFNQGDYSIVLPWIMLVVAFVIVANLLADLLYAVLDPRIRYA